MSQMQLNEITSIEEIRAVAPAWDRLWERCDVSLPTARAELVAQWLEQFAAGEAIRVLVVHQRDRMVAVLPLAGWRYRGLLPVGGLTGNVWSFNGELLLDPEVEQAAAFGLLAGGLDRLPWPLVWLDMVPGEAPRWQAFVAALRCHGLATDVHPRYRIGLAQLDGDFARYESERSKNLRRQMGKDLRRLRREGPVEGRIHSRPRPDEAETLLRRAFEVERRSWREESGQTVLDAPGMFEFFVRQARQLAAWGYLRLAFLEHRGEPIAFELGWTAKGVYHSLKVGYLSDFRCYSPGHLLRRELLQSLCSRGEPVLVDFQGPMTDAIRQWSTSSYQIARLIIAPRRFAGRALLAAYKGLAPLARRVRLGR